MSVAAIRLHKAALAAIHRSTGHEDPTTHERVKQVMGGIARSRGRAQRQAKPLTAEALAAVRATATGRRPLGGAGKRQESKARATGAAGNNRKSHGIATCGIFQLLPACTYPRRTRTVPVGWFQLIPYQSAIPRTGC